jgi:hypothetical protein
MIHLIFNKDININQNESWKGHVGCDQSLAADCKSGQAGTRWSPLKSLEPATVAAHLPLMRASVSLRLRHDEALRRGLRFLTIIATCLVFGFGMAALSVALQLFF